MGFVSKLLSFGADKDLKRYKQTVETINGLEPTYQAMSDDELKAQTTRFRERLDAGESLDALLPEAFATVREASRRVTGMRHFDEQLIGGMALHEGQIAEMKTGEGKTLVSTLAGYLNALTGKGVHIVTVNDYLAKRDSEWMGRIYRFLGMTVGLLQNGMPLERKRPAYAADVTYGTNSEFGFDYLRDNMVVRANQRVQRGHAYAIVDEVDSILIDEARTPLIISGAGTKSANTYKEFARAVRGLKQGHEIQHDMLAAAEPQEQDGDFVMDEAKHTIAATEQGLKKIEQRLGIDDIYADLSGQLVNHLQQALKAQYMFHRDKQYVVTNGEVKIVDEFTGRIMEGRRYSEGLHQAIEAKEGVLVREENQTLATITLQNYFRLYDKLSGMTGTALTEDAEFREIYKLPVQVIPTHKPVQRIDHDDLVYRTVDAKFNAVADDIERRHAKGQPVLVGTVSIESSERLSRLLDKRGIKHEILNAKFHEREAHIVAQAGRKGAVTIATNMAGRGTDILLGGNAEELTREELHSRDLGVDDATLDRILDEVDFELMRGPDRADIDRIDDLLEDENFQLDLERLNELGIEVDGPTLANIMRVRDEVENTMAERCLAEHDEVADAKGLTVIGTERHESRRIDNQLRGRSGRQGDPGSSRFYLSFEDPLLRLFALDRAAAILNRLAPERGVAIEAGLLTRQIEGAQRKVEGRNFDMRKQVLEYDDVANDQRKVIYFQRNEILTNKDVSDMAREIRSDVVYGLVDMHMPPDSMEEQWDIPGLEQRLAAEFRLQADIRNWLKEDNSLDNQDVKERLIGLIEEEYAEKVKLVGERSMADFERNVMLQVIDNQWREHLAAMDHLRQGIHLRSYAQKNPKQEYKREAFAMFENLWNNIKQNVASILSSVQIEMNPRYEEQNAQATDIQTVHSDAPDIEELLGQSETDLAAEAFDPQGTDFHPDTLAKQGIVVHRNDPCPCGSGLKYKQCHGKLS